MYNYINNGGVDMINKQRSISTVLNLELPCKDFFINISSLIIIAALFTIKPTNDMLMLINIYYILFSFLYGKLVILNAVVISLYIIVLYMLSVVTQVSILSILISISIPFLTTYFFTNLKNDNISLSDISSLEQQRAEFYANLSHELRTPINVILAAIQMMCIYIEKDDLNSKDNINRYLCITKQNCFRLLRLINNLIDSTKIDAGYLKLNIHNYEIVSLVENIVQSIVEYAKNQGIEVVFDTEVEELYLACDPDKVERIVLNLLSNAIKFTPIGGNIMVYAKVENEKFKVSVKDTGCGILEDKIATIFDRYKQVESGICKNISGSGIGLSLVKNLVNLHGGDVEVKSKVNEGSEFSFTIPIRTVTDGEETTVKVHNINIEKINIEFSDIYS